MKRTAVPQNQRIYVTVTSAIDQTGFMQPKEITWEDGRTFQIDAVRDFRPASAIGMHLAGDCYTVVIRGQTRHLFFERSDPAFSSFVGRWFVETPGDSGTAHKKQV